MSLINIEKLAQVVSSRMGTLFVEHKHCSRVRSPLSNCSYCIDICPVNAISFGSDGIIINRDCLDCGLCAGVCPTSALNIQEPTELALLQKLAKINETTGIAILNCRPAKSLAAKAELIACLGSLSWEFLLALDAATFQVYIVQSTEHCNNCHVTNGGKHFLEQLKKSRKIATQLNVPQGAIQVTDKPPQIKTNKNSKKTATNDPGRRAFLSSIFSGAKSMPKTLISEILDEPKIEDTSGQFIKIIDSSETSKLRILKNTLTKHPAWKTNHNNTNNNDNTDNMDTTASRVSTTDDIAIDELQHVKLVSTCYFCRACSILCPLGAIKQTKDYQLILDTGKCTGCKLCVDICVHKSIGLAPANLNQVINNELISIATGAEYNCQKCSQPITSSEPKEICFICEKKPNFF